MGSDSRARPSRAARMQLRYWLSVMHCVSAPVWRKPWLAVLGILGVALGAAVVVAIELAADSASRAHARSVRSARVWRRTRGRMLGGALSLERNQLVQAL